MEDPIAGIDGSRVVGKEVDKLDTAFDDLVVENLIVKDPAVAKNLSTLLEDQQ